VGKKPLLLAALAALVVLGSLAAAVVVPPLLDWTRYRDTIATLAGARLGRVVTIAGPISLTLWPAPELSADQVDVAGDGHGGDGFHIAALRLRVRLGPLLEGRIEARELVMRGLDLRLPWPLPQSVLASRPPRSLGAFAARIEGGTLRLGDLTLTAIDASVSQAEDGLLAAAGTGQLNARTARFTIRLGTRDASGAAGLDVSLDGVDALSGSGASFTGSVAPDGSLAGHVMARGTDLGLLIAAPSLPFRADGRLTIGDGLAAMDEANFDLGGAPASGALALRWTPIARLDVALSATRIDLDPWLAALFPAQALGRVHTALPVGLDLAVEAGRLGGGTVQRLRARADMDGGQMKLSEVSAELPGEAQLRLEGIVDAAPDAASRLTGTIRLDAPALRTTLRWLSASGMAKLPLPAGGVLRTASIAATLTAEPGSFALDGLAGRIDGAAVTGSLRVVGGAHPGFAVDVATDSLALDPWLSDEAVGNAAAAPGRWLGHGGVTALIGGETAQVAVRAEQATLRGLPIEGLAIDAAASADGRLTLRQLAGTARGLRLSAAGTIGEDGRVADARLSLSGPSAAPLAGLAPAGFGTPALWKGSIALAIQGGGPPSALAIGIALDLGDGRLEAQPVIDLNNRAWRASATLHHPGAARLLGMLGLSAPPDVTGVNNWLGEGSLSLMGQFSGAPGSGPWGRLAADSFEVTAGTLRANGQLAVDGRQVSGHVVADILPVPFPDATSQTPLPLAGLHGWRGGVQVQAAQVVAGPLTLLDNAAMTVSLAGDVLTIAGLTGRLADGQLTGGASLNFAASPPALTAAVALHDAAVHGQADDLPVELLSGRLDGTAALTATGYSTAALLATLSGTLHATARDGALAGFDLFGAARAIGTADARAPAETEQDLRAALQDGTTSFDRLDIAGEAAHGLLSLTGAQLQGPAGHAQAQGSIGLTDGTMDVQVALAPSVQGSPIVGLRLDGLLTAPSRQIELAAASRWLAERPSAH
jgi:hypothetical protein